MTYQEMFILVYGMYKRKIGHLEAKRNAVQVISYLYEYNNGKPPEGIEKVYGTSCVDSGR